MKRYERLVFKVAHGFGKSRESALDITQNAFLRAYNKLGRYDSRAQFSS